MTQLVLNYSTSLLEVIWENLKGIGRSFIFARQMSANREIAEFLYRTGEYNSYHEALTDLNEKCLNEMKNA
jgi:hypothetical protein